MLGKTALLLASMILAVLLACGVALAATIQCPNRSENRCVGTSASDILNGHYGSGNDISGRDDMFGRGGDDILRGFSGSDDLSGQVGEDRLFGGGLADELDGGPDNDTLNGQGNEDDYIFHSHWGRDFIDEVLSPNYFHFRNVTDDLLIDLNSGPGAEVRTTSGSSTINWKGNVIFLVESSKGDDRITGNALHNVIRGYNGDDRLFGGPGDDFLHGEFDNDIVDGGSGVDSLRGASGSDTLKAVDGEADFEINCGSGEDTAFYDEGLDPEPLNCEVLNPAQ